MMVGWKICFFQRKTGHLGNGERYGKN